MSHDKVFDESVGDAPFGIIGFDKILPGGFMPGEPAVIRGSPGTGKTMLSLAYALQDQAPSVFCTFDEDPKRIQQYLEVFKADSRNFHIIDFRGVGEMPFTGGDIDLGGLMARLKLAVDRMESKRVIMDAIDVLFENLPDTFGIRQGLRELFSYARENQIQFLCTMGMGTGSSARSTIVEYAADCVIHLSQDISQNLMTRNLRIVKSRGRSYGTNVYPFVIDELGVTLAAITSTPMDQKTSSSMVRTGNVGLDKLLAGGVYEDSSIIVSGESGSGKSLLCQSIVENLCEEGYRVLYCSFEESPGQIIRNAKSIGLDLGKYADAGMLRLQSTRSVEKHLEQHLIDIFRNVSSHNANVLVVDPISSLHDITSDRDFKNFAVRLCSFAKTYNIVLILSELVNESKSYGIDRYISSLADTWIRLRREECNGEFTRLIYVHKSRGFAPSNQIMEFKVTNNGLELEPPYLGPGKLVYGSEKAQAELWDSKEIELKAQLVSNLKEEAEFFRARMDVPAVNVSRKTKLKLALVEEKLINEERELEYLKNLKLMNEKLRS